MIIIPDVHGRDFWKEAVNGLEHEEIVFLGDYVDPYCTFEDWEKLDGLRALTEVIAFKKEHPESVTLLLGNHDLSYMSRYISRCRHDYVHHHEIQKLLLDNILLFQIAYERRIAGTTFLLTHAGILPGWMERVEELRGKSETRVTTEELNALFHADKLYKVLGHVSAYRGGRWDTGSCVWADLDEHFDYWERRKDQELSNLTSSQPSSDQTSSQRLSDVYQIFGHTLQVTEQPVITTQFACLDCRHAFSLNESGTLLIMGLRKNRMG